ncbi:MAG: ATP-grasp domain-containing protein [Halothiobacillus sp.]|jgi:predicted ATP-grasp superfamily ATP-dependent carboligase|nr:ATP-grasp domain-containing protein [Halothiobacillus sp.]
MKKKVWFNKNISVLHNLLDLIRQGDTAQEFHLIASHPQENAMAKIGADEWHVEPEAGDAAYVDWCIHFCKAYAIDLFIPGKGAKLIAARVDEFLPTKVSLVADAQTLQLLDNKAEFTAVLDESVPAAETRVVKNHREFTAAYAELSAKYDHLCIKPAVSIFGLGFRVIDERHNLLHHILKGRENLVNRQELEQAMAQSADFNPALLLMEYLPGPEWSVDCLARHGQLIYAVQRLKSEHIGAPQTIDDNQDVARMTEQITVQFRLNGMFNVQFRLGKEGIRVLEINTRPSGGSPAACLAGPNLPLEAIRMALDANHKPPVTHCQHGMLVHQSMLPIALGA